MPPVIMMLPFKLHSLNILLAQLYQIFILTIELKEGRSERDSDPELPMNFQ